MASKKRDQLIETAVRVFCENGFHATGVDRIIEEAGVARMTLYKHFKSKDELILAAIRRQDEVLRNWFMRTVERRWTDPKERLLGMFDALDDWLNEEHFFGCPFVNASAEFPSQDDPIHRAARDHKVMVVDYIEELCADAKAKDPTGLAYALNLLLEGATTMAYVANDREAAKKAQKSASILIDAAEAANVA